jgi:hypothetical protein
MEPEDEEACAEPTAVGAMPRSVINQMMADAERREALRKKMLHTGTPLMRSGVHIIDLGDRVRAPEADLARNEDEDARDDDDDGDDDGDEDPRATGTLPFFSYSYPYRLPHDTDVDPVEVELEELLPAKPDQPVASADIALAIQETLASEPSPGHRSVPFPALPVVPTREPAGAPSRPRSPHAPAKTFVALVAFGLGLTLAFASLSGWLGP